MDEQLKIESSQVQQQVVELLQERCDIAGTEVVSVTLAEHVRAELNVEADALSRIYEPGAGYTVPAALQGVPRVAPAPFQWRVDGPAPSSTS